MEPTPQDQPNPPRILIVEDEAPIRLVWERFLERWGLDGDTAVNGLEGLERARTDKYRLVITDLTMPVMTGQEMVKQIKQEMPHLEIIVTTGQATIETAVEMMRAGAYDFIAKPINFSSAEYTIRKCLESIDARKENARLREVNRELEELHRIKQKFLAITSHELRTPVGVLSNILELLEPAVADTEEESLLVLMASASTQLREIVEEMHEISKLNSREIVLRPVVFPLAPLCEELAAEQALVIEKRGHRVEWNVPAGLSIRADRAKLKKVIRELVQNAIKFTPDGGEIEISAEQDDSGATILTVADNGIGIPEDERENIFQMFYEIRDSLHHHSSESEFLGGGMGVGLTLVGDIVAAHGGSVAVGSAEKAAADSGTRFVVTLPRPEAAK